jgi:RNA recognition motif. (a.k.a. RRM, RBD, or RNP domain)
LQGVVESISETTLRQVITQRFGQIKELEVVRSRACAFLEFAHLDSAKRAITASLPPAQGGGGGVRVDIDGGQVKIVIETRKERGERPVSRPRGGTPGQTVNGGGDGRSGFRGRVGTGGGRGRGGPK